MAYRYGNRYQRQLLPPSIDVSIFYFWVRDVYIFVN